MIISNRHMFIFLKTNKTAGTSLEIALSRFCGPADIITPISPDDELLRAEHHGLPPQNHRPSFAQYSRRDWLVALRRLKRKRFYNHIGAREVRLLVGDEIWNSYFKFCFERNPWDRVLSLYWWRCSQEPRPSLAEFLRSPVPRDLIARGSSLYLEAGRVMVDRVCRYEDLSSELEQLRTRIGLPEPLELPHAKAAHRADRRHYREVYSPAERDLVANLFHREIELWGYEF